MTSPTKNNDSDRTKNLTKNLNPNAALKRATQVVSLAEIVATPPQFTTHLGKLSGNNIALYVDASSVPIIMSLTGTLTLGRYDGKEKRYNFLDLGVYGGFHSGVSRTHATLIRRDGYVYLQDLNSSNGTWMNSQLLTPHNLYVVPSVAVITLGKLTLTIYTR